MFKIIEGDFKNNIYGNEEYLDNWPMLYLLENGKQIYIGESNHVKTRMTQHSSNVEKKIFDKVHFIYSKIFNQSVTFDYESKLIQYIVADELFQVTNKNSGIADKQYYKKQEYDKKFELLWRKLQREKLVKHSLEEIENSDLFKYSPYKELNDNQRSAVETIIQRIREEDTNRIVINGMPGSGKTIVAVYLMKYLTDCKEFQNKQIGFVVPQTSLRKTMKIIFKSIYGLRPSQVLSPSDITKKKYDKISYALDEVEGKGYGIVTPSIDELVLEEPEMVKQGSRFGVRLKATAPSIHLIKTNVQTEVSPIVGSEKQSEELVNYLLSGFENDPKKIWESNIFGKSLNELVNEGLQAKLAKMPEDAQIKLQETLERIVNEGSGGLICIIL